MLILESNLTVSVNFIDFGNNCTSDQNFNLDSPGEIIWNGHKDIYSEIFF